MLAGGVGALLGRSGSPAAFGPEQASLALGQALGLALGLTLGLLRLGAGRTELGRQRR